MPSTLMLLSNPYRPDPRVLRESRGLMEEGIKVKLIAWDRDGGFMPKAHEEGVEVHRVGPRCAYRSAGKVISRLPRFWWRALKESQRTDFDIVHAHDLDTLPLGLLISRLRNRPLVYDAHELYYAMIRKDVGAISDLVWVLERALSRRAGEIITVNERMAEVLSKGRTKKAKLVRNSPDTSPLTGADVKKIRAKYGLSGFVISYLGSLEPGRFIEDLSTIFGPKDGVCVALGGNGTLRPIAEKAGRENPAVRFLGTVSTDESLRITFASDLVAAVHNPSNPNYKVGTPIKVLEAMACGRPTVTCEGLDINERVREAGCGFFIGYNRQEFVDVVRKAMTSPGLLAEMGARGKEYYGRELSWNRQKAELLGAYRALLGPN
jgi:glycosyltransferase involved in cell wall biosynthesis